MLQVLKISTRSKALEVEMATLKCVSKMDQGELLLDDLINIAGAEEQDQ